MDQPIAVTRASLEIARRFGDHLSEFRFIQDGALCFDVNEAVGRLVVDQQHDEERILRLLVLLAFYWASTADESPCNTWPGRRRMRGHDEE